MPPRVNFLGAIRHAQASSAPVCSTTRGARDTILRGCGRSNCTSPLVGLIPGVPTGRYQRRMNSTKRTNENEEELEQPKGPNQDTLPHVSEEAAAMARIMGKRCGEVGGPELEQGTPIEDIVRRDRSLLKNMPKVIRDKIEEEDRRNGKRSFSTSARSNQQDLEIPNDPSAAAVAEMIAAAGRYQLAQENMALDTSDRGYKFSAPPVERLPPTDQLRKRYEPILEQFARLIMKDGKLAAAHKNMNIIVDHLRTSPPPNINPDRPLLPGPPSTQLPLNPVLYLSLIVDSVAPLLKIIKLKGFMGGGAAMPIPRPLTIRQRRRTAINWIIDASEKRRETQFAKRLATELVAVAEGRSAIWDKRAQIHKEGMVARSNLRALEFKR